MTTAVTRPYTVTARIDATDAVDSAPAPDVYTATVYMNTHDDNFDGYEPHHPLAAAIRRDDSPLRLLFRASDRIRSHEDAADAAFEVGNHQGPDDNGQTWPDNIRSVSVGDVIKITGPDARTVHLSVDSYGFSPVPEPTTLVALTDPRVTHRD
ncbi:hypothetical protein ACIRQF_31405 [Streptomyces sp. NPDC101191]|uniref:hypothetical protein n=1 Tax=Streptomyces sp. NPDC101191 TaxID=3366126 RepID=UPI003813F276